MVPSTALPRKAAFDAKKHMKVPEKSSPIAVDCSKDILRNYWIILGFDPSV